MKRHAVLATLFAMAWAAVPAKAIVYNITSDHCTGTGGCLGGLTSGGTITLTQQGANSVLVQVALDPTLRFISSGLHETFDFNLIGQPNITVSNISNSNFFLPTGTANVNGLQFDGVGQFEYALDLIAAVGNGAGSAQAPNLSFVVTATGLTTGSFATLGTAPGTSLNFFGIDVYNTVNGNTGAVDAGSGVVPEPTSVVLFGTVLAGVGLWLRKRVGVTV